MANLGDHYQRHNHNHYYIQQNHDYQNQPNKSTISTARSWWPTWATAGQLHAYMALRGLSHRSAFNIIIITSSIINNKTTIPLWLVWCRKLIIFRKKLFLRACMLVSGMMTAHTCSIPNNYNHSPELTQSPCNRLLITPAMETFQIRITPFKNFGKICLDYMASMMI